MFISHIFKMPYQSIFMKKIFWAAIILLSFTPAFAQENTYLISGKVIDANTRLPLPAASVFAQNSTIGTATDTAGNFKLRLPNGGYNLVITFTGYETVTRRITTGDTDDKSIIIDIRPREKSMEDVVIKSSSELKDGLEKYGSFFLDNFIGKTANSMDCVVKNKEALKFYFSKKRNRLKVLASAPIEIENKALGYRIKYTLDSFTHDYNSQSSTYSGNPLFEEIPVSDSIQQLALHEKRIKAYKGSILHFMRSIYNQTLKQEGFEIQFIVNYNNIDTAIHLKDFYGALNYSKDDSAQVVEFFPNQQQVAVLYNKEKPDPAYLLQSEYPAKDFQLSIITIPAKKVITIEQNGFYYDQNDITITGYWSWGKVADMVPYDFKP